MGGAGSSTSSRRNEVDQDTAADDLDTRSTNRELDLVHRLAKHELQEIHVEISQESQLKRCNNHKELNNQRKQRAECDHSRPSISRS